MKPVTRRRVAVGALAVLALSAIITGAIMLSGGGVNSAAAASRVANNCARKADTAVDRLEIINDSQFNFPKAIGTEFFVTKTPARGVIYAAEAYTPRHFDMSDLCMENPSRVAFLQSYDDLYALCADMSAANSSIERQVMDIRQETIALRGLAAELSSRKFDHDWKEFNQLHTELEAAIRAVKNDRNQVNRKLRILPRPSTNINPEAQSIRYMKVMESLNSRVEKLETLKDSLQKLASSIASALGKQSPQLQSYAYDLPESIHVASETIDQSSDLHFDEQSVDVGGWHFEFLY